MQKARVTVCVPTIGRVEYLQHTLQSLIRQSFSDMEILVLDNASQAVATERLAEWCAVDRRIRVLRMDQRIGMFENFNRGIQAACGEYLAFCHDDDELEAGYVGQCVEFMTQHAGVAFCGSNYSFIDSHGRIVETRRAFRRDTVWKGQDYILRMVAAGRNPLTMQSIFYRRSSLPPEGIDTNLSPHFGDMVFLMRIAEHGDVGAIATDLVRVRRHSEQASRTFPMSVQVPMRTRTIEAYCDEFLRRHPDASVRAAVMREANRLAHRLWMGWSWLTASCEEEALSCIGELGDNFADRLVGFALRQLSNSGLRQRVPAGVFRAARGLALRAGL